MKANKERSMAADPPAGGAAAPGLAGTEPIGNDRARADAEQCR
jgi:hypothetical protein